jgi:hypothetical protein
MTEPPILLKNLQREPSRVRIRIGGQCHLEHCLRQGRVEIETISQSFNDNVFGQVQAVAVEEAVVCQSVHHRTWTACCCRSQSIVKKRKMDVGCSLTIAVQSKVPLAWLQVLLLSGSKRKARSQSWKHSYQTKQNVLGGHHGWERCTDEWIFRNLEVRKDAA